MVYHLPMSRSPAEPTVQTLKRLFSLSGNYCAFRDPELQKACEEHLADENWDGINAEVCHIYGARPKSARYESTMTDEARRDFENLILLCPTDHNRVDNLEPHRFSPEVLKKMKQDALRNPAPVENWASEALIDKAVSTVRQSIQYLMAYGYVQFPAYIDADPIQVVSGVNATLTVGAPSAPNGPTGAKGRSASNESFNTDSA